MKCWLPPPGPETEETHLPVFFSRTAHCAAARPDGLSAVRLSALERIAGHAADASPDRRILRARNGAGAGCSLHIPARHPRVATGCGQAAVAGGTALHQSACCVVLFFVVLGFCCFFFVLSCFGCAVF